MQISSINSKTTNFTKYFLFFIIFISFSNSTLDITNLNSNLDKYIILEKLYSGDLSILENKNTFFFVVYLLEYEKNSIIYKKSFEGFNKTLIFKLIKGIKYKIITINHEFIPMEETNEILEICIEYISKIYENNIHNNFINKAILNLLVIYSNKKDNILNFENFNEKIIPIIIKILDKEIFESNDDINNSTKNISIINKIHDKEKYGHINFINNSTKRIFLKDCIDLFKKFMRNYNFFINLDDNIKLQKLFITIIDEYISFVIIENDFLHYSTIICDFFNNLVFEFIENDYSCLKIYLKLIDCYYKLLRENLEFYETTYFIFYDIKRFLNNLLKNTSYLENITHLDTLRKIFSNIVDVEIYINTKKVDSLSIYIIQFYIEFFATISKENNEKICEIIEIFEKSAHEFITFLNSFEICQKNSIFNCFNYNGITNYLYHSNINFENDKFNNPILINNIKKSFHEFITKIVILELEKIDYKVIDFCKSDILYNFLYKNPIELEKFDFKNIISNKITKKLKKLFKKPEDQELSENINLTIKDKNLLEFGFLHDLININEVMTKNLLIEFFNIYSNKISESVYKAEDIELYIVLSCYITNLMEKLGEDESSKYNFLEKTNKLTFETEIQEFMKNEDRKDFKKLFIVKFIRCIKESKNKILDNIEEIYKENFKNFMINFIDNFKKLDEFNNFDNNINSDFKNTVYNDFMKIFYLKIGEKWHKNYKNNITVSFWSETKIRKEIIAHLNGN